MQNLLNLALHGRGQCKGRLAYDEPKFQKIVQQHFHAITRIPRLSPDRTHKRPPSLYQNSLLATIVERSEINRSAAYCCAMIAAWMYAKRVALERRPQIRSCQRSSGKECEQSGKGAVGLMEQINSWLNDHPEIVFPLFLLGALVAHFYRLLPGKEFLALFIFMAVAGMFGFVAMVFEPL